MLRKLRIYSIMLLCAIEYRKHRDNVLLIKGEDKDYPKYLVYTNDEYARKEIEGFFK